MALKRGSNGQILFESPKWTPHGTISCKVTIEELSEVVPYHATPDDTEAECRELFELISTKHANEITPCTDQERFDNDASLILNRRSYELRSTDWIANGDVMLENQIEWLQYRQDLRDITLQEGYPNNVDWPEKPELTHSTPLDTRISRLKRQ